MCRASPLCMALAVALAFSLPPRPVVAQAPGLELDHVYIVVTPPVAMAVEALRQAGITIDTEPHRHDGQGTASIAAFFENAYLELLWVDSTVPVDSAHLTDLAEFRRAASWTSSGASPFGLGLHLQPGAAFPTSLPSRRDPAPHLGPNCFYSLLRQPAESLALDTFIMPAPAAVTAWLERFRARNPTLFTHPLGLRRITHVTFYGPPESRPRAAGLNPTPIAWESAPTRYIVVEFDGGGGRHIQDLRPALPLVLQY